MMFVAPAIVYGADDTETEYEEIAVNFSVLRIGNTEVSAMINGQQVYLPVKDIFDFLKIQNTASARFDSIGGFFINPKAKFLISKKNNQILYLDKIYKLKPTDLVKTATNLYLKSEYFGKIFGLECTFDFRTLSVILNTKVELPAIREMQMELMHKNMSKLKDEKKADTTIERTYPFLKLGAADWALMTTRETEGINNTRVSLGLGAVVAGGEANAYLNYVSDQPFDIKQQFYYWRFVNNDYPLLRQIAAGNIFTGSISSVYAPVTGIQLTNTPTAYRKSFGTYRLSNTTEPGWMVELYINNVLVNFVKADPSGFFTFEVPLIYGNSVIKLRFYSPWGEERIREQNVVIPFNFLPIGEFQYNLSAGMVSDKSKGLLVRANMNYGLSRHITLGGGMEYLSTITSGKYLPYLNASARISANLLVSGEHVYGVRSKGTLSYRLPSNIQLDINYTKYEKEQTAVRFNYLEEKKAVISLPFHVKEFSAFSRLTVSQFKLPTNKYTSAEFLMSSMFYGISSNFTTNASYTNAQKPLIYNNGITNARQPYVYSIFSLTFRLPAGIRLTPQVQYEYSSKSFSTLRGDLEKNMFNRGFLNLSYEKNMTFNTSYISLGLRYNFSFTQTAFSVKQSSHVNTLTLSSRGSLLYDERSNKITASDQTAVGKGGLTVVPFLDLNCNGKREPGEPKAFGLNFHVNGGITKRNNKDTTIRISGLEAYTSYLLELDKNSFENIAWQMRKQTISVVSEPNFFKLIEVPIAVVGEVNGTVYVSKETLTGQGRIIVNIYNTRSELVAKTLSEADGFFSFMGLAPGSYTACIDNSQLLKLQMSASPAVSFNIKSKQDGDVAEGLKFVLQVADVANSSNQ